MFKWESRIIRSFLYPCFAVLLLFLLYLLFRDVFYSWEVSSLSVRQRLYSLPPRSRATFTPLSLIGYDARTAASDSFHQIFGNPMSRSVPAYVVRFLKRSNARGILFDLSFNGGRHRNDLSGDNALISTLHAFHKDPPIASAYVFSHEIRQDQDINYQFPEAQRSLSDNALVIRGFERFPLFQTIYSYNAFNPPFQDLLTAPMRFYAANSTISKSNPGASTTADLVAESRRWTPFSVYGQHIFPTLALGLLLEGQRNIELTAGGLLQWQNAAGQRQSVKLGANALPLIKWYGHGVVQAQPVYPEFSLSDVVFTQMAYECETPGHVPAGHCALLKSTLYQPVSPDNFRNRFTMIGMTLPNAGDTHQTIYGPRYYGLHILANTFDNLYHDDFVLEAPLGLNLLFCLLLPGLMLLGVWRFKSVPLIVLWTTALALGHFLISVVAYNDYNLWLWVVNPILSLLICFTGLFIWRYLFEQRKRNQLRFAFGKYVSPAVMEMIERQPDALRLGGVRREMTFLFSDIRQFTTFSDHNPPEDVQRFLSDYFSLMNGIILHDYRGTINKLIGDAIMAYWGFPLTDDQQAILAVSASLAMRDAIIQWNNTSGKPPLQIGIGINTGEAVIGNVGSDDFMDFTVIGDAVNVAARIEQLTKEWGCDIIISEATYEQVKDAIETRYLGAVQLRGRDTETKIYEPLRLTVAEKD